MAEINIRILEPGDEAALEAFLLPRLESSMFLLGNIRAAGLVDNGNRGDGAYAASFVDGWITGIAAHFWNGNIILQDPALNDELWQTPVRTSGRGINGVLGPGAQVRAVHNALKFKAEQVKLADEENLFKVNLDELIIPASLADGQVRGRRAQADDLDLLTDWSVAYNIEALYEEDGPGLAGHARESLLRRLSDRVLWVLEADGKPVAMSAFNTTIREAVQVGGVYTPPELRGRGYARAVVAQSLLDARAEGVEMGILFTGQEHVAAQRAYESIGFRVIDEFGLILYREPIWLDSEESDV